MNKDIPKISRNYDMLCLDRNENFDKLLINYINNISSNYVLNCNLYPDNNLELLTKLSDLHGIHLNEIITTNGSEEALSLIFNNILKENDLVVKWKPTFSLIDLYIKNNRAETLNLNFIKNENKFIFEKYTSDIAPKLFYISSPNSPTGNIFEIDELINLLEKFKDSYFVLDGAYVDYSIDHYVNLYNKYDNIILTRSFSKSYGIAGLRAGYYITKYKQLQNLRPNYAPNSLASFIICNLLDNNYIIKQSISRNNNTKNKIYNFFKQLNINYIETIGNFILFESNKINLLQFSKNVLYKIFNIDSKTYIKLSICDESDIDNLKKCIKESLSQIG